MFNNEAIILIDALSNLNPSVRDTVLDSLRKYHEALDSNQVIFTEAWANYPPAVNDSTFGPDDSVITNVPLPKAA